MLKKLLLTLMIMSVSLFAINFQTASKSELMSIKGIGEKRATAIIKYRKTNKIRSASDLEKIPGIGKEIANNAKRGIKSSDHKKTTTTKKRSTTKDSNTKKRATKKRATKTKTTKEKTKKKAGDKPKRAVKKEKEKVKKSTTK